MLYFVALIRSLGNLPWLKSQRFNLKFAVKYFCLFFALVSIVAAVPFTMVMHSGLRAMQQGLRNAPEFSISVKDGQMEVTGLPQPWTISDENTRFAIVIDTRTSTTLDFERNPALNGAMLISRESIQVVDFGNDRKQTIEWKDAKDGIWTRDNLLAEVEKWQSVGRFIFLACVGWIVLYIGLIIAKIYALCWVVMGVFLLAKIANKDWRFRELFVVGLFGSTLPTILSVILMPFMPTAIYYPALVAFMLAVVFTKEEEKDKSEVK